MYAHLFTRTQAWMMTASASVLLAVVILSLVVNTGSAWSWLPLMVLSLLPLGIGILNIRQPRLSQ
jgi:hypothetical protein